MTAFEVTIDTSRQQPWSLWWWCSLPCGRRNNNNNWERVKIKNTRSLKRLMINWSPPRDFIRPPQHGLTVRSRGRRIDCCFIHHFYGARMEQATHRRRRRRRRRKWGVGNVQIESERPTTCHSRYFALLTLDYLLWFSLYKCELCAAARGAQWRRKKERKKKEERSWLGRWRKRVLTFH